jgi:hypothetical protein
MACACDICGREAVRLFLCPACWSQVPPHLSRDFTAMSRGVKTTEKMAVALEIMQWAKAQVSKG